MKHTNTSHNTSHNIPPRINVNSFDNFFLHDRKNVFCILGGAGSIGSAFVDFLIRLKKDYYIYIVDNDDHSIWKIQQKYKDVGNIEYILSDVRSNDSKLVHALKKSHFILHCAAYKNIQITEENVEATISNDYIGVLNIVNIINSFEFEATIKKHLIFISTDKAVKPISTLGACKFISENLILSNNPINRIKYSVARFVNVIETRGNVFEIWKEQFENSLPLTITDINMFRYLISINKVCEFLYSIFQIEINTYACIPKIYIPDCGEAKNILNILEEFYPNIVKDRKYKIIGRRKNEKLIDELYTNSEVEEDKIRIVSNNY